MSCTPTRPCRSPSQLVARSRCQSPVPRCRRGENPKRCFHRNQQYSVVAVTDGSGAVVERYAYSAYGTPTVTDASGSARTTTAVGNRYTYTGREWDETLVLYHYRARMYDSAGGRFVSRDPIGFYSDAWNIYSFVGASPLVRVDPSGLIDGNGNGERPGDIYDPHETFTPEDRLVQAICIGGACGIVIGGCVLGAEAVVAEVVDTTVETVTGIPIIISPADILQDGGKMAFRCVCRKETKDVCENGWRGTEHTMKDKCFLEKLEDAERWFDEAAPDIGSEVDDILGVPIPRDVLDGAGRPPNVDGIGPGIIIWEPDLPRLPKPTEIHPRGGKPLDLNE